MRITRRKFLQGGLGAAAGVWAQSSGLSAAARLFGRERVRIAVWGLEPQGLRRAAALAVSEFFDLQGLGDSDEGRLRRCAALLSSRGEAPLRQESELDALCADEAIEAVVIAAPVADRAALAARAARAGKAAFVEWPLGGLGEEGIAPLRAAFDRSRRVLQLAVNPLAAQSRSWAFFLASGRIGRLAAVRARCAVPPDAAAPVLPLAASELIDAVNGALGKRYPMRVTAHPGPVKGSLRCVFDHRTPEGDRLPFEVSIVEGGAGAAAHPLLVPQLALARRSPTAGNGHPSSPVATVVWRGNAGESRTRLALDGWTLEQELAGAPPSVAQLTELAAFARRVRAPTAYEVAGDREPSFTADRLDFLVVTSLRRKRAVRVHPETGALLDQPV